MTPGAFDEAYVKISVKGYEAVKAQIAQIGTMLHQITVKQAIPLLPNGTALARPVLPVAKPVQDAAKPAATLASKLKDVYSQLDAIGAKARVTFFVATAGILGFVKAASPGDFMKFESAVARVSVQIGALFLPVIRTLTQYLNKLADALNNLTPQQRDQIGHWTKLGLVALAFVGGVTKLLGVVPGLIGGFSTLSTLVKSLAGLFGVAGGAALGWVGIVAGIVAGVVALGAVAVKAAGKWDTITAAATKLWKAVVNVAEAWWSAAKPVLAVIGNIITSYLSVVWKLYGIVLGVVAKIYRAFGDVFAKIAPIVQGVVDDISDMADELIEDLQPLIDFFEDTLTDAIEAVVPVIENLFKTLLEGIKNTVHNVRVLAEVLRQVRDDPSKLFDLSDTFRDAEATISKREEERRKEREKEKNQGGKTEGKPQGPILAFNPEMFGISEAMRKAQTAALGESPAIAMQREQLKLAAQGNDKLDAIAQNTGNIKIGLR